MFVDSPEQRRLRIKDSRELAWQDWLGTAGFDRPEDEWPRRWAEAYVDFAAGEKRAWLAGMGVKFMPNVGWAERGGYLATGHGNSVPRFHLTWGTGPGVLEPFVRRVREAAVARAGGAALPPQGRRARAVRRRGQRRPRRGAGGEPRCAAASRARAPRPGSSRSRRRWCSSPPAASAPTTSSCAATGPKRLGTAPTSMVQGVPDHVDGRMIQITQDAGGNVINPDRMWHYVEGMRNWDPIWTNHGIRIIPGPSSLWFDAIGRRLPAPLFPGFDTLGTLAHIMTTGHEHTWFVLTQKIIEKEFALSGSEQNPDITGRDLKHVLKGRLGSGAPAPVEAFKQHGADFVVERELSALVRGMNELTEEPLIDFAALEAEIVARDREVANPYSKDLQITAIHGARRFLADRISRIAAPHRILDPDAGPLIAVKLHILTRKTLGGLQTDLDGRVLQASGEPLPGLYSAGEVAGFGGGGMHGYRALEGTFLGGCLFSGRTAGRAAARALA